MRERRVQAKVTQSHALRIGVVGHRHHLRKARLGALAAIVDAQHPGVAEVEVDASVRRPVQNLERGVEGVDASDGLVVRGLGLQAGADGEIVFLLLLAEVDAGILAVHFIGDVAGILDVLNVVAAGTLVISILGGSVEAVVVGIVGFEEEILSQRFGIGDPAVCAGVLRARTVHLVDHGGVAPIHRFTVYI